MLATIETLQTYRSGANKRDDCNNGREELHDVLFRDCLDLIAEDLWYES
jgi:hypothetical protein